MIVMTSNQFCYFKMGGAVDHSDPISASFHLEAFTWILRKRSETDLASWVIAFTGRYLVM
jgi:hypothetical protein